MPYTITTSTTGPSLGTPDKFYAWALASPDVKNKENLLLYLREVYRLAIPCNLPAHVIIAQSALETGNWTSLAWSVGNPAGIGVTNGSERTKHRFTDGNHSARVHVVHYALYVLGKYLPQPLAPYIGLDYRWEAAIAGGHAGNARSIAYFTGTWAKDILYAPKIADKLNMFEQKGLLTAPATDRFDKGFKEGRRQTLIQFEELIDKLRNT